MQRRGYATITYRDTGRVHEADTLLCCHCQRIILLHQLDAAAKDTPGYCSTCHAATCNACATSGGQCAFEAKVEQNEKRGAERDRLLREMGIA